jgi:AraC-like DNA-binding protein
VSHLTSIYQEYPIRKGTGGYACAFTWSYVRPCHHHAELEFNLVVNGQATFRVGERQVSVCPGSLLWFLPEQDHEFLSGSDDFSCFVAVFRPDLVERTGAASGRWPGRCLAEQHRVLTRDELMPLEQRCRAIADYGASRAYDPAPPESYGTLLRMACQAFAGAPRTRAPLLHPAVTDAARLLHSDPTLGCRELCARTRLSREELSRVFHAHMGTRLVDYRNRVRLAQFISGLDAGEQNLTQAALHAGFGSYAQFHRVFRSLTGCTPREYAQGGARAVVNARVRREAPTIPVACG